ncbi:MAG: NADH:ubiquinone oxidoreductase [Pseudomonadota bacterium]
MSMRETKKPTVAVFDFAGCGGDQLQLANLEEELLTLTGQIEMVSWREGMTPEVEPEHYDIALVEGSITRRSDEARLKKIRESCKTLVALGSCATIAGINALKNFQDPERVRRYVYGEAALWYETYAARPLRDVVKVDANVYGCPIMTYDFLRVFKELLLGKKPFDPNYPVCVDCKLAENVCVYGKGMWCMGPVTRAGCRAVCVSEGSICWGCRGMVDHPNADAQREVLAAHGLGIRDVIDKFRLYFGTRRAAD